MKLEMFRKSADMYFLYVLIVISGCASDIRPENPDHICEIFRQNPEWYTAAYIAYEKWDVPIPVLMAVMYQESAFEADARPPRTTCLFIFPGPRPSTAYGYPQALDSTWEDYQTAEGGRWAERDDFADAADFIGWYCSRSHARCGIPAKDAYNLYIAYHEGQNGFLNGTHHQKAWLKQTAIAVQKRAAMYNRQLASCEDEFQKPGGGCCLWPF
jgi:hypothetical protein